MIPIRDLGSVIESIRGLGMGLGGMPKVRAGMTTSSLRDRYSPVNAGSPAATCAGHPISPSMNRPKMRFSGEATVLELLHFELGDSIFLQGFVLRRIVQKDQVPER
jgi:hypothetical protein